MRHVIILQLRPRLSFAALVAIGLLVFSLTPLAQSIPAYDIVIRNGQVLDGAGNPAIRADVAIKDGRFARVGLIVGRGRQEIDATGRYVSPGWIDMMDQSGATLLKNGLAENKLLAGVTTAIGGEGGTPVPADGIPQYFATLESKASASTSAATSVRRRRAWQCSVRRIAHRTPRSWGGCKRSWSRPCAPGHSG